MTNAKEMTFGQWINQQEPQVQRRWAMLVKALRQDGYGIRAEGAELIVTDEQGDGDEANTRRIKHLNKMIGAYLHDTTYDVGRESYDVSSEDIINSLRTYFHSL